MRTSSDINTQEHVGPQRPRVCPNYLGQPGSAQDVHVLII